MLSGLLLSVYALFYAYNAGVRMTIVRNIVVMHLRGTFTENKYVGWIDVVWDIDRSRYNLLQHFL